MITDILLLKSGMHITLELVRLPGGIECYCLLHEAQGEALRTIPILEDIGIVMHPRMPICGIRI
jgi:hypothetical protein